MQIAAVGVAARDLSRAVAFYEALGFRFPPLEAGTDHVEAEAGGARLMIDTAALLGGPHREPPRPGGGARRARRRGRAPRPRSPSCPAPRGRSTPSPAGLSRPAAPWCSSP